MCIYMYYVYLFMYIHIYTTIRAHLRHTDGTTLGTPAGTLLCRTAISRDPDRLEERANRTLTKSVKSSEGQGQVLLL